MLTRDQLLEQYKVVRNFNNVDFKICIITNGKAKEGGILLVGMNPSGDSDKDDRFDYLNCWGEPFWDPKHKMMGSNPKVEREEDRIGGFDKLCGYIDLFPIRKGRQVKFEENNDMYNLQMGQLLSITQDYIEDYHPRLIIFANTSIYYWGFKKKKDDFEEEKGIWMGYKFNKIKKKDSPLFGKQDKDYWPVYKIIGIEPSGVNRYRKQTRLEGSFFLRYRQHLDQYGNSVLLNRELTPEDIKTIVEWIDPEWAKTLL